jgi:uncharacterized protein YegP (UPF0339 family)
MMKLRFYGRRKLTGKHEYRWQLISDNGEIVAASSEGFATPGNAVRNYKMVQDWIISHPFRYEPKT